MKFFNFEFFRFVLVGGFNTVSSYLLYVFFLLFLPYPVAYTVSYILSIVISYFLNTWFVFKEKASLAKAVQFPLVYLLQYLLGVGALFALVEWLHISKTLAPIFIVVLTIPITFVLSRFIIKGPRKGFAPDGKRASN